MSRLNAWWWSVVSGLSLLAILLVAIAGVNFGSTAHPQPSARSDPETRLVGAVSAPVGSECSHAVTVGLDGVPRPLTCGTSVNTTAWTILSSFHSPLMRLGKFASFQQVDEGLCAGSKTVRQWARTVAAYTLASAYYGWSYFNGPPYCFTDLVRGSFAYLAPPQLSTVIYRGASCGGPTVAMEYCETNQLDRDNRYLNDEVEELFALDGSYMYRQRLVAAQNSWEAYVSNDCESQATFFWPGTMYGVELGGCLVADDEARATDLQSAYDLIVEGDQASVRFTRMPGAALSPLSP